MTVRHIVFAVFLLTLPAVKPAFAQYNAGAGQPAGPAPQANPMQNPFQLYSWMAGTTPALGSASGQGGGNQWMSLQWMTMMARHFMQAPIDEATRFGILDAMLRATNAGILESMVGGRNQGNLWLPSQSRRNLPNNTPSDSISDEAKRNLYQSLLLMSPLSLRDMLAIMADKMPVAEDVSFEDAVDSMKLRANEINFKLVGHSPLWKDVVAITGDEETPRVEIFNFCDAVVARKVLDYAPEFVVFLPCRIALLEDAERRLWVMTLDWDVNWLNTAQNPNSVLDQALRDEAMRIRDGIRYIMQGAASGDF